MVEEVAADAAAWFRLPNEDADALCGRCCFVVVVVVLVACAACFGRGRKNVLSALGQSNNSFFRCSMAAGWNPGPCSTLGAARVPYTCRREGGVQSNKRMAQSEKDMSVCYLQR